MERFQSPSFDVNVSSPMASSEVSSSYQTSYPSTPLQSFTSETYGSESSATGMDYASGFDSIQSALHSFQDSSLPSFQDTYNIHGTYTYMRQASEQQDTKPPPEFLSSFRDESSQGEKFPIQYHGQYQAFTEESYLKHNFLASENPEFYKQSPAPAHSNFSQEFSSPNMPGYNPDQKDTVFHGSSFQGSPGLFQGSERQGFQGYPPGYYEGQRISTPDTNFNYPSPGSSGIFPLGRQPYQRRSSLTMDTGYEYQISIFLFIILLHQLCPFVVEDAFDFVILKSYTQSRYIEG